MPMVLTRDEQMRRRIQAMRARQRDPGPWTRDVGQHLLRRTRRDAPVDRGTLRRSLNVQHPTQYAITIVSDQPHAKIQDVGGRIVAGRGPLGSRLLAIPLNDEARAMIAGMGRRQSLRTKKLTLIRSRRGRLYLMRPPRLTKRGKRRRGETLRGQLLFRLDPAVTIRGKHYTPDISEPETRAWIDQSAQRHLLGG